MTVVSLVHEQADAAPSEASPPAAKGLTLYEAVEALGISESWLEEAGGELTPEVEALLNEAEGSLKEKVERVALKVKSLEAEGKAIKEEADRLVARAKARANGAASLKRYLEQNMIAAGMPKVVGLLATVTLQLNPPAVQVASDIDLRELYEGGAPFVTVVPESFTLDKKEVLAAVKRAEAEGKDQDAVLPASIRVTRSQSLRIR